MVHPVLTLIVALAVMTAVWPLSIVLRDVSIIDIFWAPAFAILGWTIAIADRNIGIRGWICLALVSVWAARLGSHIFLRHLKNRKEDHRYTTIRRKFGRHFAIFSLFIVFWLQAFLLWLISWPLQAAISAHGAVTLLDFAGWTMTLAGITIEGVADAQLNAFRASPKHEDRTLDTGLWRWTRHPNYFGDFLIWWGFFIVAVSGGGAWWTIIGPIVMSALLMHFSGAGLMEETITARRPAYSAYIQRTSSFFPWPPSRQ